MAVRHVPHSRKTDNARLGLGPERGERPRKRYRALVISSQRPSRDREVLPLRVIFFSNADTRAASWEICRDPNQVKKALSLDLPFVVVNGCTRRPRKKYVYLAVLLGFILARSEDTCQ